MARARSQSSWLRCLSLSYYIRRPRRLAILCMVFVAVSFLLWHRHDLIREHELQLFRKALKDGGEDLPGDLDVGDEHDGELGTQDKQEFAGEEESNEKTEQLELESKEKVWSDGPIEDAPSDSDLVAKDRRNKVREAMIHAWSSYEQYAWGYDELKPLSKHGVNQFGGLGATIVDSLDTLYIMGLNDQFKKAMDWVANELNFNKHYSASVFETTIRVLGGLLSAYDLSGEKVFLTKAQDLADRLLPAWNTGTGIPLNTIELASGTASNPQWTGGSSTLADLGTEQVEFIGLSQRTGDPKYREKVENVIKQLSKVFPSDGLLPIYINPHNGHPTTNKVTLGAMGDSFYEYLLKVWIQGNKTEAVKQYREMWEKSMEGMKTLIKKSQPSSYTYIAERSGSTLIDKMDELACFAPGMLVLGTYGATPEKSTQYLNLAEELARTCYNFYMSTHSKLAGENYVFRDGEDMVVGTSYNILRPETVESLMYLWRKTGDNKYRDWGWDIFQAFEKQSRTPSGYVGLRDVNTGSQDDLMQSFFLAETLKYLYLLFSPPTVIPLDKWVFNTEAHPLRIISRFDEPSSIFKDRGEKVEGHLESTRNAHIERMNKKYGHQHGFGRKGVRGGGTSANTDYQ